MQISRAGCSALPTKMENIKLFFQLYIRPGLAMSEIMDRGSWIAAAAAVLLVSAAFFWTINVKLDAEYRIPDFTEYYQPDYERMDIDSAAARGEYNQAAENYRNAMAERKKIPVIGDSFFKLFSFSPANFFQPVLLLSLFYIPVVILLACIFGGIGNFGVVFRRDYAAIATCTLMSWAAAHTPFAIAGIFLSSQALDASVYLAMWFAGSVLFGVLMVFALRTVFGLNFGTAILTVCIAWLALSLGMYVFQYVSPWLFSPFLLILLFMYFGGSIGGEVSGVGNAFRQKQNFKRFLHNATVNPKDADAHLQLALIYLQRRQEARAVEHLTKALAIDENEIDANYEMGKIVRMKGDLTGAIGHFSRVVEQDDRYALSEVWREIGATYLTANMLAEARDALTKFTERRSHDIEGLYYLGKVLKAQGNSDMARETFQRAVESANSSPDYRRQYVKAWRKLAEKEI